MYADPLPQAPDIHIERVPAVGAIPPESSRRGSWSLVAEHATAAINDEFDIIFKKLEAREVAVDRANYISAETLSTIDQKIAGVRDALEVGESRPELSVRFEGCATGQRPSSAPKTMVTGAGLEALEDPLNKPGYWHVMISYTQRAPGSVALAAHLYAELTKLGLTVWLDVKMDRRDEAAMREAATHCRCVIAIVSGTRHDDSDAYFNREYCLKELRWAKAASRFVQPVVSSEDKPTISEMMALVPNDLLHLRAVNWEHIDWTDVEYFELGVAKILRRSDMWSDSGVDWNPLVEPVCCGNETLTRTCEQKADWSDRSVRTNSSSARSKILRQEKTWSNPTIDYCRLTLGVTRNASAAEIRKLYHRKALTCHPDRFPRSEWAAKNAEFQNLSLCYSKCLEYENGTGWTESLSNAQRAICNAERVYSTAPIEGAVRIRRADLRLAVAKIKVGLTEVERAINDEEAFEAAMQARGVPHGCLGRPRSSA